MKKKVLVGLVGAMLISSVGFAAPFNTLEPGQTAVGLTYWGSSEDDGGKTISDSDYTLGGGYLEHRFDKVTVGYEGLGRSDSYSEFGYWGAYSVDQDTTNRDIYLHYHLNDNVRLILGSKTGKIELSDSDGYSSTFSDSKTYVGAAYAAPLSDKVDGYVALTTADVQLGVNANFSKSFTGNLFYRTSSFSDQGESLDLSGIGFGLGLKF
jgi:hypothetical protein